MSSLQAQCIGVAAPYGGVTASTGLLVAERHAGVWTPVIAHKTISADNNLALAA
jgi:hypothetical protein